MQPETVQALKAQVNDLEIKLKVACAKVQGAAELYVKEPSSNHYSRTEEFLIEAESIRFELRGVTTALKTILDQEFEDVSLTDVGASVLTDAALSA